MVTYGYVQRNSKSFPVAYAGPGTSKLSDINTWNNKVFVQNVIFMRLVVLFLERTNVS